MYTLPDVSQDRWEWLAKAFGDYLLLSRTYQSTQSRLGVSDWSVHEGGQVAMRSTLAILKPAKKDLWEYLGRGLFGTPFDGGAWPDDVNGLSMSQVAFVSGAYASCFLPRADKETGEVSKPMGIPNVAKAWAYHGLHVVDGSAPKYTKGETGGFDRDIRAKLIHRVGAWQITRPGYYRDIYVRERAKKDAELDLRNLEGQDAILYNEVFESGAGTPWPDASDGHKHAHALRVVTKEVIKDWWRVLHGQEAHAVRGRSQNGTHGPHSPDRVPVHA